MRISHKKNQPGDSFRTLRRPALATRRSLLVFVLLATPCFGQAWSGVLSPNRAIDWSHAGLPLTLPDGETTPNPWTPPTRPACTTAQAGTTVPIPSSASISTINSALAACASANPTGSYLLLGSGTFAINNAMFNMYAQNGVTLRGSGPMSTTVELEGTSYFAFSYAAYGNGFCTTASSSTIAAGATSITGIGCSGNAPVAGQLMTFQQCDSGFGGLSASPITDGAGCALGSSYDNGALYVCGNTAACQRAGESVGTPYAQTQEVYVTSVENNGGGSYAISFNPGLYLPNWGATINGNFATPMVSWSTGATGPNAWGVGLEDMTVYETSDTPTGGFSIPMFNCYACWVKGVRYIAKDSSMFVYAVGTNFSKNSLVVNSYLFNVLSMSSEYGPVIYMSDDSDNLVLNNMTMGGVGWVGYGSMQGDVIAYNEVRDVFTGDTNGFMEHGPAGIFLLREANDVDSDEDDDTHGTHDLNTYFREHVCGSDFPYQGAPHASGFTWSAFARFENAVGNSLGCTSAVSGSQLSTYLLNSSGSYNYVYGMGFGGHTDPLVQSTSLRWGNWDQATGTTRWCGNSSSPGWSTTCSSTSEIPTSLTGAAIPFENTVPSTTNLPCSFFLAGYTSTTCTAHSNGGTGLSWWKVCTTWSTFPTACSASQAQPFPAIGPDVTGGTQNAGTVYDIPALAAWRNLPIDASYQTSYAISGSSWSAGVETLTISFANSQHLMGGFQLTGVNTACLPASGVSYTGRADSEILITNSSANSVSYALPSNPGVSCAGSFLFPDVRQFDERVYQSDSGSTSGAAPNPPTGLTATVN